jgi:aquaporin Z
MRAHSSPQLRECLLGAQEQTPSFISHGDDARAELAAHTAAPGRASETLRQLRRNSPEYLIEAWALGTFMVSAGVFATLFDYPGSPIYNAIADPTLRRVLTGIAMGITAIALIYSPWGRRSGAHMNPAVTLTFLRLGKVHKRDALFFMLAQFTGGTLGVLLVAQLLGRAFTAPPVSYAATLPGPHGATVAFVAETAISMMMIFTVLLISSTPRMARFTGLAAGCLVAIWIAVEGPFSGMSMNPARSFASAAPALMWQSFWIYVTAPVIGMLAGAELFLLTRRGAPPACAKLLHSLDQRCIHCGYEPPTSAPWSLHS